MGQLHSLSNCLQSCLKSRATGKLYSYRVMGKETCRRTGRKMLVIQDIASLAQFQVLPEEIVMDIDLLKSFSPQDVQLIAQLAGEALQNRNPPVDYIICCYEPDDAEGHTKVIYQDAHHANRFIKTAQEISLDANLINKFKPLDAYMIGYLAGMESVIKEPQAKIKAKLNFNQ